MNCFIVIFSVIIGLIIFSFKDDYKRHRGLKRRSLYIEEPSYIICESQFSNIENRVSKYSYRENRRKEEDTDIFLAVLENKIE